MATFRGVSIEWEPPCEDGGELVYGINRRALEKANEILAGTGWQWVQVGVVGDVPSFELREVRDGD